jgi:hypothetical protein
MILQESFHISSKEEYNVWFVETLTHVNIQIQNIPFLVESFDG